MDAHTEAEPSNSVTIDDVSNMVTILIAKLYTILQANQIIKTFL